jgi:hypothetical protein
VSQPKVVAELTAERGGKVKAAAVPDYLVVQTDEEAEEGIAFPTKEMKCHSLLLEAGLGAGEELECAGRVDAEEEEAVMESYVNLIVILTAAVAAAYIAFVEYPLC